MEYGHFGKRLRQCRNAAYWTQEELAWQIGYKTFIPIFKLETRANPAPYRILRRIANALEISIVSLIFDTNRPGIVGTVNLARSVCDGVLVPKSWIDRVILQEMGFLPFIDAGDPGPGEVADLGRLTIHVVDGPPISHVPSFSREDSYGMEYRGEFFRWVGKRMVNVVTDSEWEVFLRFCVGGESVKKISKITKMAEWNIYYWLNRVRDELPAIAWTSEAKAVSRQIIRKIMASGPPEFPVGEEIPGRSLKLPHA